MRASRASSSVGKDNRIKLSWSSIRLQVTSMNREEERDNEATL